MKSQGIVIYYLPDRGHGYLRLAGTREEFHFRREHLLGKEPEKGDLVLFRLKETKRGYVADEIEAAHA